MNTKTRVEGRGSKVITVTAACLLLAFSGMAANYPIPPATQAQVNAGTDTVHPVTPATLANWTGGVGPTGGMTQAQMQGSLASGTNNYAGTNATLSGAVTAGKYIGDGSSVTNLILGPTVSAGNNITVTRTQNPHGETNTAVAVIDPMSLSQANVGVEWSTNFVTPTNAFAGTLVDFSHASWTTNLGGNLTFTGVANLLAGGRNSTIISMMPAGADRTIAVPASWHIGRNDTLVVSNAFNHSDFLFTCQPGLWTNIAQKDYP